MIGDELEPDEEMDDEERQRLQDATLDEDDRGWLERNVKQPRRYSLYCGKCRRLLVVAEAELPDGEVWICPDCVEDSKGAA